MSPRLHHGEISPRQIWHAVQEESGSGPLSDDEESFLSEIAWREFSYHLLHHYDGLPSTVMRDKFADFPWRRAPKRLERWKRGQTGYPIVDAGMRQLWGIGWMHNRLRMTVASFLTKDLLVGWQDGERHFWDTLVGGDLANNSMGWQWAAGCGPDAQPFFRIFNPVSQGEQHDPNGDFVRRWVPELADLPTEHLHAPWDAPDDVLDEAGVTLGQDYPEPMVDHSEARDRALAEYNEIK
jgi:deoxyribodipyrimidine photo-lyase